MNTLPILATSISSYKVKSSANRAAKKALIQHPIGATFEAQKTENGDFIWVIFGEAVTPKVEEPIVSDKEAGVNEEEKPEMLRKSWTENPCQLVWNIAEKGLAAGQKRKDIIATCVNHGVAFYTARTQYQKYTEALRAAE